MCKCYRNFIGNDCSERLCPFGISHVDAPKGDLDHSKTLSSPMNTVISNSQIFPYGTEELFTNMNRVVNHLVNTSTPDIIYDNAAHGYSECSNAGACNRNEGACECYDGYEGSSCQRVTCPSSGDGLCSGHGICYTKRQWAKYDNNNYYELWDADMMQGCVCDASWYGVDCRHRRCDIGVDPAYLASKEVSTRVANWSFVISHGSENVNNEIHGHFTITFYDVWDEDYTTQAIQYGANCSDIITAIEALPNDYVRTGEVACLKYPPYHLLQSELQEPFNHAQRGQRYGTKYTVLMPTRPGKTKQPHINIRDQMSGNRATLQATDSINGRLGTYSYPNGFTGEDIDYVPDFCLNVDVNLFKTDLGYDVLGGLTFMEKRLLKRCLGDSNGVLNFYSQKSKVLNEEFEWDYGSLQNPHLIKLVDATVNATTDLCAGVANERGSDSVKLCEYKRPAGFYAILVYHQSFDEFRLMTPAARDFDNTTDFYVFTTKGSLQLVSQYSAIQTLPHEHAYHRTIFTVNSTNEFQNYLGNVDCESNAIPANGLLTCVEKGDLVFLFDNSMTPESHQNNPSYPNIYTVQKASIMSHTSTALGPKARLVLDYSLTSGWDVPVNLGRIYIFTPSEAMPYAGECSFRGECNTATGLCQCHIGYEGADCGIRDTITAAYASV